MNKDMGDEIKMPVPLTDLPRHSKRERKRKRSDIYEVYTSSDVSIGRRKNIYDTMTKPRMTKSESKAINMTKSGHGESSRENRRLNKFSFHDYKGKPIPLEMLEFKHIYISGLILPFEQAQKTEVRCTRFGHLKDWSISGFDEGGEPILWLSTELADYECLQPASSYKKIHTHFYDKSCACIEIYKKLSKSVGGNPDIALEDLVAQVGALLSEKNIEYAKSFIYSSGEFIYNQLIGLDSLCGEDDTVFGNLPVLLSLKDYCHNKANEESEETKLKNLMRDINNHQAFQKVSEHVMKSEKVARSVIAMLKEEKRPSRVSFDEIVKRVSELGVDKPGHISSDPEEVQAFLVDQGKFVMEIFVSEDHAIKNCTFVRTLQAQMKEIQLINKSKKKEEIPEKNKSSAPKAIQESINSTEVESAAITSLIENIWKRGVSVAGEIPACGEIDKKNTSKGDVVTLGKNEKLTMYRVEYIYVTSKGKKIVHGRQVLRGSDTVLGKFADNKEMFLTNNCKEFKLAKVVRTLNIILHKHQNLGFEYLCNKLYLSEMGGFFCLEDTDSEECQACKVRREKDRAMEFKLHTGKTGFSFEGVNYIVHDFLYLLDTSQLTADKKKKGKPYIVCQLLEVEYSGELKEATAISVKIKVRRFFRPDDISAEKAYASDIREIYYSNKFMSVQILDVCGKCEVRSSLDLQSTNSLYVFEHIFFCALQYDPENGGLEQLPSEVVFQTPNEAGNQDTKNVAEASKNSLVALDLFSGCGGLSEGLEKSGVSVTKWALEYDKSFGKAFGLNHPRTTVLNHSSNVILTEIMLACKISSSMTAEAAAKLDSKEIDTLPRPGQVDFIYGGPPCQGFSQLNRCSNSAHSVTQRAMTMNFLSYVDVFKPRFVLLENVRHFTSSKKGNMFQLTLASLIKMGYQVRFGILQAGAYGISQSRRRVFIWAASPGETLPEWPEPMHVFTGGQQWVNNYVAVRSTETGAPFRSITVRDAIGDLPEVSNGASNTSINYAGSEPKSWFQKRVRGDKELLTDQITKKMTELRLTRCQEIPRCPGADWKHLQDKKIQLSNGISEDLIPPRLKRNAAKKKMCEGAYGRIDWEGHFPTTVTDPHPEHQVGRVFHPEQNRILTVREYARSQGFSDSYNFFGALGVKYKQIGNAVPPPLAFALGRTLKEALDRNCQEN